jgi:citrate synthase
MTATASGLEGVIVADTELSDVDGSAGRLVIAGSDVESLAGAATFEEVFSRLVYAGNKAVSLGGARQRAWRLVPTLRDALGMSDGMDALRASVARVDAGDPEEIAGAVATFAAAWSRIRDGREPLAPDPSLGHAADYARMILGAAAPAGIVRALDAYLVTVADHGMNASTFVARVIASTGSDLTSSVTGAIGALKGPLHGGAPGPVLDMLDAIGTPDRAELWIRAEIAAGRRIMGMGHRIYRVRDPRAAVFEREIQKLEGAGLVPPGGSFAGSMGRAELAAGRLALARAVEKAAERVLAEKHPERPLRANVEFYTAVLLEVVGVPRAAFSPTFAVSRVAGWCAHAIEQRKSGRLIRPSSRYVGARPQV